MQSRTRTFLVSAFVAALVVVAGFLYFTPGYLPSIPGAV